SRSAAATADFGLRSLHREPDVNQGRCKAARGESCNPLRDSGGPDWSRTSGTRFRKPLLYPSELRGHGRATLVHRFDLREAALALDEARLAKLATELATVSSVLANLVLGVLPRDPRQGSPDFATTDVTTANRERDHPRVPKEAALLLR